MAVSKSTHTMWNCVTERKFKKIPTYAVLNLGSSDDNEITITVITIISASAVTSLYVISMFR
jgi:hypothetical protein